jgi:hypothetical protein
VFVDEAGFYLLPAGVWTYAPRGQTPILRVPLTRDHLAAISAITPADKLYIRVQNGAFKGPAIVRFCVICCITFPASYSLSGMVCPLIAAHLSKTFWHKGPPNGSIWNNCPAMPQTSIPMKESGAT